jgi:hypothetical protein
MVSYGFFSTNKYIVVLLLYSNFTLSVKRAFRKIFGKTGFFFFDGTKILNNGLIVKD